MIECEPKNEKHQRQPHTYAVDNTLLPSHAKNGIVIIQEQIPAIILIIAKCYNKAQTPKKKIY